VHAGVYPEEVTISTDDITLSAKPGAVLQGSMVPAEFGILISAGVSGVTVEGFEIRNYGWGLLISDLVDGEPSGLIPHDNTVRDNVLLQGNTISNIDGAGIFLSQWGHEEAPAGNLVSENNISDCQWCILLWQADSDNIVQKNTVSNAWDSGINVSGGSSGNTVSKNMVSNSQTGINVTDSGNIIVQNNEVSGTHTGINMFNVMDSQASGNTMVDLDWGGIQLNDSSRNIVEGNMTSGGGHGIVLDIAHDNKLLGNTVTGSEYPGIQLSGSDPGAPSTGNHIINNRVSQPKVWDGIVLQNAHKNLVENNDITGGNQGISLQQANDNQVMRNKVSEARGNAIAVHSSIDNLIEGNDASARHVGIGLWDVQNTQVRNNKAFGFFQAGILVQGFMVCPEPGDPPGPCAPGSPAVNVTRHSEPMIPA